MCNLLLPWTRLVCSFTFVLPINKQLSAFLLSNNNNEWWWWMWTVAAYRQTHSSSWLTWSEVLQPAGAEPAFVKCTGWIVIMMTQQYNFVASAIVLCLSVCLFVSNFAQKLLNGLHEIFREGWQFANEQMIRFWWRSGSPSGYRDSFTDLSLLRDTESGINRLHCATLQGIAIATMTSLHHWPMTDVAWRRYALSQCF